MPFPKVDLSAYFDKAVVIDIESGGFSVAKNAFLEVGALLVNPALEILDSFHTYVKPEPGLAIDPGAAVINGYKPELWGIFPDTYVPSEEEIAAIYSPMTTAANVDPFLTEWLRQAPGAVGIAFNAPFDKSWMTRYAPTAVAALKPDWICALQVTRRIFERRGIKVEKGMAKLGAACDTFGYEKVTGETWVRHTALDDCYAARFMLAVAGIEGTPLRA